MKSKHSLRDSSTGRFIKLNSKSCQCGKNLCQNTDNKIVAGRLYDWNNVTVRAFHRVGNKRFIAVHKTLTGLVNDSELKPISKEAVQNYLQKA